MFPWNVAAMRPRSVLVPAALVALSVASAWLTATRLRVSSDLAALLPDTGDAAALVRWTRAFGGRDPVLVLLRGEAPEAVGRVAERLAARLRQSTSLATAMDRVPAPPAPPADPTLAWAYAGPEARARLAAIVGPDGMRARLLETRALLLAPGADEALADWVARDPLRLTQVPWETGAELASGARARPGSAFEADGGRARLVLGVPRGSAFVSEQAQSVMRDVRGAIAEASEPGVTAEVAGGHAIAVATEDMLRRDLTLSGTLSAVLASLAFLVTFRRARALAAVLPPLFLGTLWTTGLAALLPGGLSAVAIAFAAVVVGVGVDTGVHVYAALLDERRAGHAGADAARRARAAAGRPTLTAAAVAAVAFGALALGGLRATKELGLLCAAGELLTAIAILLVTPAIGAWIERGAPPPARTAPWTEWVGRLTATRGRALAVLLACIAPVVAVAIAGWPGPADALVAIRPRGLAPLVAERHVFAAFGGSPGQWVVLSTDRDEEAARAKADRIAEALSPLQQGGDIDGFDALASFAPSASMRAARLAQRDALDLPSRAPALESALREAGFEVPRFSAALEAFRRPTADRTPSMAGPEELAPWLLARHVARDASGVVVATYLRPKGDASSYARVRAAILAADPGAAITGFGAIDAALRATLARDLALIGGLVLLTVAVAMRVALRSTRAAAVALGTLACEMGAVGLAMRLLSVRWHVYDALVLPVLFGVTIDESMFLLDAARRGGSAPAMRAQGPLVAATALTTAAGFAALLVCRFDGLRDLGAVGALGVLAGLVAAVALVPAASRLFGGLEGTASRATMPSLHGSRGGRS
jgi:predicted exporter